MTFTGIPVAALDFYEDLEADNSKSFWTAHKHIYEESVRTPLEALAAELEPEFGSPKLPMTPEALLLSALDDLEAKMQAMRNEFARDASAGKSGAEMTEWVRSMDRPLLNTAAYLSDEQ